MEIEALLVRWQDEPDAPPASTLYALSGLSTENVQAFLATWPSLPDERREQAVRGMVEIAEASFEVNFDAIFWACLEDPSARVRARAVDGLWEDETPALRDTLLTLLASDPSPEVRSRAAAGLGRFVLLSELGKAGSKAGRKVAQALLEAVGKNEPELAVRRRALESLAYSSRVSTQPLILEAYRDPDRDMRVSALFAMGRSLDPQWGATVIEETESSDPEMRYEAARACGELELEAAVPALISLVDDPDFEIQSAAIWALGQIGGRAARQRLMACVRSEDRYISEAAEEALAELEFSQSLFAIPLADEESGGSRSRNGT
ncbi:MAG: HEAT repeat domain-containing protein [Anaerolineae bacterium]